MMLQLFALRVFLAPPRILSFHLIPVEISLGDTVGAVLLLRPHLMASLGLALFLLLTEEGSLCWWLGELFREGEDLFDIVSLVVARF